MPNNFDLVLKYKMFGAPSCVEYLYIYLFTEEYENGVFSDMENDMTDISIMLFGKKSNVKKFNTLNECYNFCCEIMS